MSQETLAGKAVWIEMDRERSTVWFSPRKGTIVHVVEKLPRKKAVVVELFPRPLLLFPFPHRLAYVLLEYPYEDEDSIERTFRIGLSIAEVFKFKRKKAVEEETLKEGDISRVGIGVVHPWPLPSAEEVRRRLSQAELPS